MGNIDFDALTAKFRPEEIEWRIQRKGYSRNGQAYIMLVPYIDSRAARHRLNAVVGPENWQTTAHTVGNGIAVTLSIRVNGEWVSKTDGAGETNFEAVKGAFSDAFKRACYAWGIGEYLYDIKGPMFADINPKGDNREKIEDKRQGREEWVQWDPPQLPAWAIPDGTSQQRKTNPKPGQDPRAGNGQSKKADSQNGAGRKRDNDTGVPEANQRQYLETFETMKTLKRIGALDEGHGKAWKADMNERLHDLEGLRQINRAVDKIAEVIKSVDALHNSGEFTDGEQRVWRAEAIEAYPSIEEIELVGERVEKRADPAYASAGNNGNGGSADMDLF